MSCRIEKQARAEAMLGELAELGLMVARELAVRLRECEDVEGTVALADAFQKASRVVRLTLALNVKLERDAARDAQAAAREAQKAAAEAEAAAPRAAPPRPAPHPIEIRKDRVRNLLNRLIWNESEGDTDEYDVLLDDLSARLHEAARSPDFEELPIEALARRVIADMGLSGELTLSVCEGNGAPASQPQPADTGQTSSLLVGEGARRRPDG